MNKDIVQDNKIYKRFFAIFVFTQIFMILFRFACIWVDAYYGPHDIGFYNTCASYDVPYYAINYDNGLIVRGLAGELFGDFLLGFGVDFAPAVTILKIIYTLIFSGILISVAHKYFKSDPNFFLIIVMMFMRPFYLNSAFVFAIKVDIFWYACMIPVVLLLLSDETKHFNLKMAVIIICSFIAMLFHHSFIFVFAPFVCACLLDKKKFRWFVAYGVIMCLIFVILLKFFSSDYDTVCAQAMANLESSGLWDCIKQTPDRVFLRDGSLACLRYEYGTNRLTQLYLSDELMDKYLNERLPAFRSQIVVCGLSLMVTIQIFDKYFKTVIKNKLMSALIITVFALPFVSLVLFTIDIDRWFMMTLTSLNIFALYVAKKYDIRINIKPPVLMGDFAMQLLMLPTVCYCS